MIDASPIEVAAMASAGTALAAIGPRLVAHLFGGKRRDALHEITAHMDRLEKDNSELRAREDAYEVEIRKLWRMRVRLERALIALGAPLPPEEP